MDENSLSFLTLSTSMTGIEQEQMNLSWANKSIEHDPETFTVGNTPTGPQLYSEPESKQSVSEVDFFATPYFQPSTCLDTNHSFGQNIFQDLNENLGPRDSAEAAETAPPERLSCLWLGCNSSFRRQGDLQRHVRTKHVQPHSYKCAVIGCEKTFSRSDKFQGHLRTRHAAESSPLRRDASTVITRANYNPMSFPAFESFVTVFSNETKHHILDGSDPSGPIQMYRIPSQDPQSDRESSTPATEYSYAPMEESCGASDLNSNRGSISTRSKSPYKTITSNNRNTSRLSSRNQDNPSRRRFACPYQKHDPRTYNSYNYHICASSSWDSVSRVK
jgi:hypothetical protein